MRRKNHIEELEARRLLSVSASSLFVFTTGTKLTYQITSSGNTATSTTTVKGAATFNGHNAIEIDGTTSNVAGTSKSFVGLDGAGNAVSYGSSGTTAGGSFTDTNTPPAINFPATMNAGTTYTENWGTHDVFAGGTSDSTTVHTVKLTSASLVSVAVPAGTFNAYLFNETDTITAGGFTLPTSTIQQWIVPNKGLVKSVITSSGNTTTEVLIPNNVVVGPAAKLLIAQQPTTGKPGVALTPAIKVNVTDANGNIVTGNTSTVALSIFSGPTGGTLSGTLSVAASGGVATFSNVKASVPGVYVLKATDGALTLAKTLPIQIAASQTASKLAFLAGPLGGAAGKALPSPVVVAVETSTGSVVTGNTSKVTLGIVSGPSGGTISGTVGVNAVSGIATFNNLIFNKVGTYVIKATDGTLTSATSASFKITVGAAAKLLFLQQPAATTIAGKAIAPAVKVEVVDANGNLVTGNTSNVTISIATGPSGATLGGTLTVKAVGGIATFSNLVLTKAGSYALKAVDGSLSNVTSSSFKITAAAASKLAFTQQPTTGTHNTTLSAVKVAIEDAFGNIVLTNTTSVILSLASGPTGGVLSGTLSVKAVAGVATFTTLKLSRPGTYVIKATDGTLTLAKSKSIVLT